jgi:hypothetical protein
LCIEVGDASISLEAEMATGIQNAKDMVLEKVKECLFTSSIGGQAITEEELEDLLDMEEQIVDELALMYADVGDGKVVRERRRGPRIDPRALVLVETAPGLGGKIEFKSTSFDEVYNTRSGRVERKYRGDFPPPGVEVILEGKTKDRGRCLLLQMTPGASFRIERTGDLDGVPGVLTVVWKRQKGVAGSQPLEVYAPSAQARDQSSPQA